MRHLPLLVVLIAACKAVPPPEEPPPRFPVDEPYVADTTPKAPPVRRVFRPDFTRSCAAREAERDDLATKLQAARKERREEAHCPQPTGRSVHILSNGQRVELPSNERDPNRFSCGGPTPEEDRLLYELHDLDDRIRQCCNGPVAFGSHCDKLVGQPDLIEQKGD